MSYISTTIKYILPIFGIIQKPVSLNISDFKQITIIKDDNWNKIPASNFKIDFYDKLNNNKYAGYISYRAGVGIK